MMKIFKCPNCQSMIGIDEQTIYPIDCGCGLEITKGEVMFLKTINDMMDQVEASIGELLELRMNLVMLKEKLR